MKILITGGNGEFAKKLQKYNIEHDVVALSRNDLDITDANAVHEQLRFHMPDCVIHAGAMTRPMYDHKKSPHKSIGTNIIGTAYVVQACMEFDIKLIYISTDYVYPGTSGNYKETDPVLPVNEYAWTKLGGECSVMLYDNSLILRMAMCENPYPHQDVFVDVKKSLIFNDDAAKITLKLLDQTGIINIGGESTYLHDFIISVLSSIEKIGVLLYLIQSSSDWTPMIK